MSDAYEPFPELAQYARERDALLARIVQALAADPRVEAAWLSGSFGRGEGDEWADFDLHVAVSDEQIEEFLGERLSLYERVGRPILIQQEMASNSMLGARFQLVWFAGPFEVDWNIGPLRAARRPLAFQMLIERAEVPIAGPPPLTPDERAKQIDRWLTFFWAMAPIAVKHAGRAETRRAARQVDLLLSTAYIALWRLVRYPEDPDQALTGTNRVLEPELDASLPRLGETIDPFSALTVIRDLCAAVERLHPALTVLGARVPTAIPPEVVALSVLAERAIRNPARRVRKYR